MKHKKSAYTYALILSIFSLGLLFFLYRIYGVTSYEDILFWGALAVITETFIIELPAKGVVVSVGLAISIATLITTNPFVAAVVAGISFLLRIPKINGKKIHILNTQPIKTVFNITQSIIIIGLTGTAYFYYVGKTNVLNLTSLIPVILIIIALCNILNSILVSIFIKFASGNSISDTLIKGMKGIIPSVFSVCILGIMLAILYVEFGKGAVVIFFSPLQLARYTFKLYVDSQRINIETIHALNDTLGAKDAYTGGHTSRVEHYAVELAKASGLAKKNIDKIRTAALLHDIGKIGVPDDILNKKGKLTDDEYTTIKKHPEIGADILSNVDTLKEIAEIIRHHHERYDGRGYPDCLTNGNIPMESSILAIADSFDAMTTDRPYRPAMSVTQALDELRRNKGTQFDPMLVDSFIGLMAMP